MKKPYFSPSYIKPSIEVILFCDSNAICDFSGDLEGTTDEELDGVI